MGFGTQTALVTLTDNLHLHLDKDVLVLLILLELSVAFDAVDHLVLIDHLASLGTLPLVCSPHSSRDALRRLLSGM